MSRKNASGVKVEAIFSAPTMEFIDALVGKGVYRSRAEAVVSIVRAHLEQLFEMFSDQTAEGRKILAR